MSNENYWSFVEWLRCFKDVKLPIGDFARDICSDPAFPKDDYISEILEYLFSKGLKENQINDFLTIWNFYLSSNTIPDGRKEFFRSLSRKSE